MRPLGFILIVGVCLACGLVHAATPDKDSPPLPPVDMPLPDLPEQPSAPGAGQKSPPKEKSTPPSKAKPKASPAKPVGAPADDEFFAPAPATSGTATGTAAPSSAEPIPSAGNPPLSPENTGEELVVPPSVTGVAIAPGSTFSQVGVPPPFEVKAVSIKEDWVARWHLSSFGKVEIIAPPAGKGWATPAGAVLKPEVNNAGHWEVVLTAVARFPKLAPLEGGVEEEVVRGVDVYFKQYVVFLLGRGGWVASASPYYVVVDDGGKKTPLVGVSKGRGAWTSTVPPGGLLVRGFLEGGLSASRLELTRYFRDEEIAVFLRGGENVLFFIEPSRGAYLNR